MNMSIDFVETDSALFALYSSHVLYRGYYTSGHFIRNLSNEPSASLINFI